LLNRPNYPNTSPARVQVSDFITARPGNGHDNGGNGANSVNVLTQSAPLATLTLPSEPLPSPSSETYNPAHSWFSDPDEAAPLEVADSLPALDDLEKSKPGIFESPQDKKQVLDELSAASQPSEASLNPTSSYVYKLVDKSGEELARGPVTAPAPAQDLFSGLNSAPQSLSLLATPEPQPAMTAPANYQTQPVQSVPDSQPTPTAGPGGLDFFASAPPLIAPPTSRQESAPVIQPSSPPSVSPFAALPQLDYQFGLPEPAPSANSQDPAQAIKVASPLGYEKKEASQATDAQAPTKQEAPSVEEEDEETEKNGFGYEAPKRRSFSGKDASATKKPDGKPADQDEDDDDSAHSPDHSPKPSSTPGEIQLFGVSLSPKKVLLIACLACLLIFIAIQSVMSIAGSFLGAVNQKLQAPGASVSGVWRFAMQANKHMAHGFMFIHQRGSQIYGSGRDDASGTFRFNGSLKGAGEIEFVKIYNRAGQDVGKPITFRGDLDTTASPLFAKGDFQSTYRSGYSWRAQIVNITGIWEAEQTKPVVEDPNTTGGPPPAPKPPTPVNFFEWATHNGLILAGVLVAIVVFCWQGMIWLFGPDGLRSRREKAAYIPTQFKKDHQKELKQLAQPLRAGSLPLGQRVEWALWKFWTTKDVAIPPELRAANPHVLFLGGGGKGKSRLMAQMIAHDIESGDRAVVVVDSDGSTSDLIINWISAHAKGKDFAKRTMIIDPTSMGGSLAYNPLEMPEDGELPNAAAAIVSGFKAIYHEPPGSQSQWTPQTAQILYSAALLLMITNKTLADLPNLLQDNDFRDILLEEADRKSKGKPNYRPLLDSWGNYKKMARTEQWINWVEPILNRVQRTLSDHRVGPVLTTLKSDVSLKDLVLNKKILIVHIPKGELHENANILGSLIVTGLKQAALSVAIKGRSENRPCSLYVDEFDHFIEKDTFNSLTSETKVFQIGFMGATKTLQDFPEDFRNQLVAKFGWLAVFAVPSKDGEMLGPQMFRVDGRKRKHETLTNFFNPINTSPQFEFVSDERTLNVDKILGQPEREFFCYRVGSVAGLFHIRSHSFNNIPVKDIKQKLIEKMRKNGSNGASPNPTSTGKESVTV
jgi:hypothetical protein